MLVRFTTVMLHRICSYNILKGSFSHVSGGFHSYVDCDVCGFNRSTLCNNPGHCTDEKSRYYPGAEKGQHLLRCGVHVSGRSHPNLPGKYTFKSTHSNERGS